MITKTNNKINSFCFFVSQVVYRTQTNRKTVKGITKMIQNERFDKILKILEEEKFCTTGYLAEKLFVVPMTVRRDLKLLESEGLISRCHGGASLITHDNRNVPYVIRFNLNNDLKTDLAERAVKLINDGDTVILDASSTASYIAHKLPQGMNITVITNGIKVCEILSDKGIKTYCTGGRILENTYAFVGSIAENAISSLSASIMFFSSQAISDSGMISDFSEEQTELRRVMLKHAKKKYFVCDSTKIGKEFLFNVCSYKDLDGIICNEELNFE